MLQCKICIEILPYHKERAFVDMEEVLKDCRHLIVSFTFDV